MALPSLEKHGTIELSMKRGGRNIPISIYMLAFGALIVANVYVYHTVYAPSMLEIRILTAGKGNPVLVQTPHKKTLLVDTGTDASIVRELGVALPMWQRDIDAIVLTSSDTRSAGGLREVTSQYRVPVPILFGTDIPYGASFTFDTDTHVTVIAPQRITVTYGATSFTISSSTKPGIYRTDGTSIK